VSLNAIQFCPQLEVSSKLLLTSPNVHFHENPYGGSPVDSYKQMDRQIRTVYASRGGGEEEELMQLKTGVEMRMNSYLVLVYVIHNVGILIIT
jgi:hypothetical protein